MNQSVPPCAVVSLPDIELEAQIHCASRRLVVIAPGVTENVARAIAAKWEELGPDAVQVVLDPDPEVCRLGFGDVEALKLLQAAAQRLGAQLQQRYGLRVGLVVTDETTTIYSPVPRLVEAGGAPGERLNALRFESSIMPASANGNSLHEVGLDAEPVAEADLRAAEQDLAANPPVKFDLARRVRVFNARFEFVEFELNGLSISRKQVQIPSDLLGLAHDEKAQKQLRSSFQLIENESELSGEQINKAKKDIAKKFLITLPGFGNVILRSNKADFVAAVDELRREIDEFQKKIKEELQGKIDANREVLQAALLPGVINSQPERWRRYLGAKPSVDDVLALLQRELQDAFGRSDSILKRMEVKLLFKGVTYESLNDPEFIRVALKHIPSLGSLHDEFEAAKAEAPEQDTGVTE